MCRFSLLLLFVVLLAGPVLTYSQESSKELAVPRCEDISILDVRADMGGESIKAILEKKGFELTDTLKGNKLTGQFHGVKKPSETAKLDHSTGLVKNEGDTRTYRVRSIPFKNSFLANVNVAVSSGQPTGKLQRGKLEWDKRYIWPIVENRLATFCGDMGGEYYKKNNDVECTVKEYKVIINYRVKSSSGLVNCVYRFDASLYNYSEEQSIPQIRGGAIK